MAKEEQGEINFTWKRAMNLNVLFGSARTTLKERITSPLAGTFMLSWMVINWRILAILFASETTIEAQIVVIVRDYISWESGFCYPALSASFFTLIYPWLASCVVWVSYAAKSIGRKGLYAYEDDMRNTKEETTKSLQRVIDSEATHRALVQKKSLEAEELQQRSNELQTIIDKGIEELDLFGVEAGKEIRIREVTIAQLKQEVADADKLRAMVSEMESGMTTAIDDLTGVQKQLEGQRIKSDQQYEDLKEKNNTIELLERDNLKMREMIARMGGYDPEA